MARELGTLWIVKYKQRFEGSDAYLEYEDTFLGPGDLSVAVEKFKAYAMTEASCGRKCNGVLVISMARLADCTIKV